MAFGGWESETKVQLQQRLMDLERERQASLEAAEDREYKMFNVGDEIFTTKSSWSAITANKTYIVVSCKYQSNYLKENGDRLNPVILVELVTDGGYLGKYSSYQFQKTDRQIREDRINLIIKKKNG